MKATAVKSDQPTIIKPMLATLVREPFTDDDYIFEVKWDGYRIIALCSNNTVKLQSRGGEDYSRKYPSIVSALKRLEADCIIDGEVVFINAEGKPDFDSLQRVNGREAPLVYYAFDLLWKDGTNMMHKPLLERKEALKELLKENDIIKYSDHFQDGLVLFEHVKEIGLEGVVAKRKDSLYLQNDRSKKWLKVATEKRQEFVIGGWVESEKRNTFRTLLFGSYENGKLKWKGHAGGGFKEREMPQILSRLKKIEIEKNPFDSDVQYSEGTPHWVKPELVANIKFATVTRSGKIRKPAIFLGFREDKKAKDVITDNVAAPPTRKNHNRVDKASTKDIARKEVRRSLTTSTDSNWPKLESLPIKNQQEFDIGDCSVMLHNVDKELWKGFTKARLIQYYNSVSKYILPHIQHRPLSLYVKPKGPYAPGLFIKDMEQRQPECANIFTTPRKHKKAGKRDVIDYLVCNNTATLLYIIDLGCIDINPWTSTVDDSLHPSFIVIDLDPSDDDFTKAVETAQAANDFFKGHKLKAFAKTSGKTGIHLFLPCSGFDFQEARTISENICNSIHQLVPSITTTNVTIADRGTKLYIDPNQNDYADTVASVYSVRPYKSPLVSTPLEWKEVTNSLNHEEFTTDRILNRLEKKGDLFLRTLDQMTAQKNSKILTEFL